MTRKKGQFVFSTDGAVFLLPDIFDPQLVESMDVEPTHRQG